MAMELKAVRKEPTRHEEWEVELTDTQAIFRYNQRQIFIKAKESERIVISDTLVDWDPAAQNHNEVQVAVTANTTLYFWFNGKDQGKLRTWLHEHAD
jgi:hypothetical protein